MIHYPFTTDIKCAHALDQSDPMAGFRERFYTPADTIYMDGNSLGLMSKDSDASLSRLIQEWKTLAIRGWMEARQPWYYFSEYLGSLMAPLVGAEPDEVIATGATTVNIHSLISTFYEINGNRNCILADELNFPSDIYALKGQIALKGLSWKDHLKIVKSKDACTLDEDDIVAMMTDDVSLLFLSSVLYKSGQLLDIEYLAKKAHEKGILIGVDCCHSAGIVPHQLSRQEIDFAVWCSYKYLNGGPGSTAFLYVNRRHFNKTPLLAGWFGSDKEKQFKMGLEFEPSASAGRWQISSPAVLSAGSLEGSLKLMNEAGINAIRQKSLLLTDYMMYLTKELLAEAPYHFDIVTPQDPEKRGGHVSLTRHIDCREIAAALRDNGVIPDFRPPNIIRMAPVALYNTFTDVWQVIQIIKEIIDDQKYQPYREQNTGLVS